MSGGIPVVVSLMYSPSARIRRGSDHIVASCAREQASDPCAGRAGVDGLLAGLWSSPTPWTGWVRVLVEP